MSRLFGKNFPECASEVLLLGILWSGLAVCTFGAVAYDVVNWL